MKRTRIGATAVAIAGGIALIGSVVSTAGTSEPGEVSCAYDAAGKAVTVTFAGSASTSSTAVIGRHEGEITVKQIIVGELSGETVRRSCSGGVPTVDNVDRIDLRRTGGTRTLTFFNFRNGRLGPGATPEPGGDEIEVDAELGRSAGFISLSSRPTRFWTLGASDDEYRVNFNSVEKSPDADLVIYSRPKDLFFAGSPGDDRLSAAGGKGTGGALTTRAMLTGEGGDDLIVGGASGDRLVGGKGDDTLRGLGGNDRLDVDERDGADRLDCGGGDDRAGVDDHDRASGCEHRPPAP